MIFCVCLPFWDVRLCWRVRPAPWWSCRHNTGLEQQPPHHGHTRHSRYPCDLLACFIYGCWDPNSLSCSEDPGVVIYSGTAAVRRCSQQPGVSLTSSEGEWLPVLDFILPQAPVSELGWKPVEGGSAGESGSFGLSFLTIRREEPTLDFMDVQKYSQLLLKTGRFVSAWLDCTLGRKMTFFIVTWPHAQCACVSQAKGLYSLE